MYPLATIMITLFLGAAILITNGQLVAPKRLRGLRQIPVNSQDGMTVSDMWKDLKCDRIFKRERPVHSQTKWINARTLYRIIVGHDSSIGAIDQVNVDAVVPSGFSVPVEAKQSPPKGRGLFALSDIPAGSLIWSTKKTARFRTGQSYRQFIYGLEEALACDVLQWAYVQDVGGELRVSVDLDEGCFCNDAGGEEANTGCDEDVAEGYEGGCQENDFALRDVKKGEELLCAYGEFAIQHGWKKFGL